MPLPLIDAALRGMVFVLALLLAALLWRQRRQLPAALAGAALLLSLGLAVQVLGSAPAVEWQAGCAVQAPLIAVAVGNAVLFALFSAALFDDGFRWRAWHVAAWLLAAGIGAAQCPAVIALPLDDGLRSALRVALRLVPIVAMAAALWAALRHWRADLVEPRRRLRAVLVAAGIVYTLVQLGARLSTSSGLLTPGLALLDVAVLLAVLLGWALAVLQVGGGGLMAVAGGAPDARAPAPAGAAAAPTAPPPAGIAPEAPDPADANLAAALRQVMADRAYRDPELSLGALARRLAVPEYRLRRHINQQLGFRNFNAYVNGFRLADARRWLADPAMRETPVLTLALDAGFGSVGPFNRAFKADTGLTPTEFRARALAET
jgi:AraC-like DNA-binding protein